MKGKFRGQPRNQGVSTRIKVQMFSRERSPNLVKKQGGLTRRRTKAITRIKTNPISQAVITTKKMTDTIVPRTPGGRLAKLLKLAEYKLSSTGTRKVRIVERPEVMLKNKLWQSDPWKDQPCTRGKCHICTQPWETKISCRTRSVQYTNTCVECANKGTKYIYYGETGKSGAERHNQHNQQCQSKTTAELEKSHMHQHWFELHEESKSTFSFKVIKKAMSSLTC